MEQVEQDKEEADGRQVGPQRRKEVQLGEFGVFVQQARVIVMTHAASAAAEDELWEESEIESREHDQACQLSHAVNDHPPGDLGPPVVQSGHEGHQRATEHRVMKVGDNEIGAVQLDIGGQRAEEESGQPADPEEEQERQGITHGRCQADRSFVHRGQPIEDLHGRGDGDAECQRR